MAEEKNYPNAVENKQNHPTNGVQDYFQNYDDYNEETASEIAEPIRTYDTRADNEENSGTSIFGYIAIALSILSLFMAPVWFGAGGIILGFIARGRGQTGLGNWAIGIGALSLIVSLVLAPFF